MDNWRSVVKKQKISSEIFRTSEGRWSEKDLKLNEGIKGALKDNSEDTQSNSLHLSKLTIYYRFFPEIQGIIIKN